MPLPPSVRWRCAIADTITQVINFAPPICDIFGSLIFLYGTIVLVDTDWRDPLDKTDPSLAQLRPRQEPGEAQALLSWAVENLCRPDKVEDWLEDPQGPVDDDDEEGGDFFGSDISSESLRTLFSKSIVSRMPICKHVTSAGQRAGAWNAVKEAEEDICADLGETSLISSKSPPRINNVEATPESHLPHQKILLAWAIDMWKQFRGGVCADSMGMGKSHQMSTLILATQLLCQVKGKSKLNESTTLIVPRVLMSFWIKTDFTARDSIPVSWQFDVVS